MYAQNTYSTAWRFKKGITAFLSRDGFVPFKQNSALKTQEAGLRNVDQLFKVQFMEA